MRGSPPDELKELRDSLPEFPDAMGYVWDWFSSLSRTRQRGFGASPITEQEIAAFCRNRTIRMSLFELEAIRMLDNIALTDFEKEPEHGR